jgi:hypothetical protein
VHCAGVLVVVFLLVRRVGYSTRPAAGSRTATGLRARVTPTGDLRTAGNIDPPFAKLTRLRLDPWLLALLTHRCSFRSFVAIVWSADALSPPPSGRCEMRVHLSMKCMLNVASIHSTA